MAHTERDFLGERLIQGLRSSMATGSNMLGRVPSLVTRIIADDLWRLRPPIKWSGTPVAFARWEDFCRADPPPGRARTPPRCASSARGTWKRRRRSRG